MSTEATLYTIGDVARLAGVSQRTVRYYVAQGLLPTPDGAGPGAHYGGGHLERLRLIRRLQREHLPLAEIRTRLEGLTDDQIADLNRVDAPKPPSDSALDYIRALLGSPAQPTRPVHPAQPTRPMPPRMLAAPSMSVPPRAAEPPVLLSQMAPSATEAPESAPESNLERSQWERLSLGPNLELHVRRPLSRLEQRRVERLITIARQVLKEETP
jgi:DNA-binding transcriptional MerR regulator